MPLSTVAKAALCVCPPALMAGAVATVPPVKRAVHHLTAAPHATRPVHRVAMPASAPAITPRVVDCAPGGGGPLLAVPLVTYADPIPDEPAGGGGTIGALGGGVPLVGAIGFGGGSGGSGGTTPVDPGAGPVPEPSIWLMMIAGVGTLGAALRRRRTATAAKGWPRRKALAGGALWSGSAVVEAGDMAATVAMKSAVASAAGKAMLCVCPAAIVAGTVMTVPPVRQAVHTATTVPVAAPPVVVAGVPATVPCDPATVPVAATAVEGFPATVETRGPGAIASAATPAVPAAAVARPSVVAADTPATATPPA